MLESRDDRPSFQNSSYSSLRESWLKLRRSFFANVKDISRRLSRMVKTRISRRLDEKVQSNVSPFDQMNMDQGQAQVQKTREEVFAESTFEWVKTERSGDLCKFDKFEVDDDLIEYVKFVDGTRVRLELIGDVVLMHKFGSEILGNELALSFADNIERSTPLPSAIVHKPATPQVMGDPVVSILEKSKKKTEKITLTLVVRIPSPELYSVIRESFDNVEDILLNSVMEQIQENVLRESVKKELQHIYSAKKKKS